MPSRRGSGEGSIFKDTKSGLWTGVLELPPRNGVRRRKTIRRKNKRDLLLAFDELRRDLRIRGDLPSESQTVAQWMTYWLEEAMPRVVRPKTAAGYRSVVVNHVIPVIGAVRLDRLQPAHIRRVHDAILSGVNPRTHEPYSPTYATSAHRAMSTSFEMAVRENRIGRNPAKLTAAPRPQANTLDVLSLREAVQVLEYLSRPGTPDGARWAVTLLTGARRGEVIGLELDRVGEYVDLEWQLQRFKKTDRDGRPDAPADLEYRHLVGGLYLTRPKSNAGVRRIPLVDPLKTILERHIASMESNPYGLVFTAQNGRPIDPDQDSKNWRAMLEAAGVKGVRLHDARHTAVDLLYLAGVPEDVIVQLVGHSKVSMTRSYQSRTDTTRLRDAMERFSAQFTPQIETGTPPAIGE